MAIYTKRLPLVEARRWDSSLQSTAALMGWMYNSDVPFTEFEMESRYGNQIILPDGVVQLVEGDYIIKENDTFKAISEAELTRRYELVYNGQLNG